MTQHSETLPPRDRRPSWFSVLLCTSWILMAWQVHGFLVGLYFTLQVLSIHRPAQLPEGAQVPYFAPAQVPESDFFVQFFGVHALLTTIAIAAVILGKDLFLSPAKARIWNIALAIFCGVLLFWGRLAFAIMEGSWGIVH